jgi:hypothetical protein
LRTVSCSWIIVANAFGNETQNRWLKILRLMRSSRAGAGSQKDRYSPRARKIFTKNVDRAPMRTFSEHTVPRRHPLSSTGY